MGKPQKLTLFVEIGRVSMFLNLIHQGAKKMKSSILFLILLILPNASIAGGYNQNVKYYGYDWLDYYQFSTQPMSAGNAFNAISTTGFSPTNLNVVHGVDVLEDDACAEGRCALSVQAGSGDVSGARGWADICRGAISSEECQQDGSWNNIWHIVQAIKMASHLPSAIYFIDEPFANPALKSNGQYVKFIYPSYVCTLRQAMEANGLDIPVFTILSYSQSKSSSDVSEIQRQMPSSGCPVVYRSTPDWIGVDNYNWSESDMWATYNFVAPLNVATSPKWVLVPPSTESLGMNDQQLHDQIQLYWNFLVDHPTAPVITIMNWKFDRNVILNRQNYPKATALLSFMANTYPSQSSLPPEPSPPSGGCSEAVSTAHTLLIKPCTTF